MRRVSKQAIVFCLAAVLLILPMATSYAFAADTAAQSKAKISEKSSRNDSSAAGMAVDLVLARPLGIVSTALGCVIFVASLPFSLPGGNSKAVFKTTVVKPAAFTFARPLGEFD